MTVLVWDSKDDILRLDTSLKQTLNAAVCVKCSAVNYAVLNQILLVGQKINEGAILFHKLVKVWIVNAQHLIQTRKTTSRIYSSRSII